MKGLELLVNAAAAAVAIAQFVLGFVYEKGELVERTQS